MASQSYYILGGVARLYYGRSDAMSFLCASRRPGRARSSLPVIHVDGCRGIRAKNTTLTGIQQGHWSVTCLFHVITSAITSRDPKGDCFLRTGFVHVFPSIDSNTLCSMSFELYCIYPSNRLSFRHVIYRRPIGCFQVLYNAMFSC